MINDCLSEDNNTSLLHSHQLDYKLHSNDAGKKLHRLVASGYLERDATGGVVQSVDYAGEANLIWCSGLVVKDSVGNEDYDWRAVRMHTLVHEYNV